MGIIESAIDWMLRYYSKHYLDWTIQHQCCRNALFIGSYWECNKFLQDSPDVEPVAVSYDDCTIWID